MPKDAYYFSHDSNAKDDPKCMLLIDQLGLEGYGMFWVLVEILRDQPGYKYPLNLVPIIARRYNTTAEKMLTVVKNYGLFQIDKDENFFSFSLNQRMEHLENVREKRILAGLKSGESRKLKALNKCSTNVQDKLNKIEQSKVKESKVKETKSKYGSQNNVLLTISEYERLKTDFNGVCDKAIEFLSLYKAEKNYKTKSDNLTIRRWVIKAVNENTTKKINDYEVTGLFKETDF